MSVPWSIEQPADPPKGVAGSEANNSPGKENNPVIGEAWTEPKAVDYTSLEPANYEKPWGSHERAYEWKDEYGDVGPKYPELELELFGDPDTRHERTGVDFAQ